MKKTDNPTIKDLFFASCGWCEKFKQNMGSLLDKKNYNCPEGSMVYI